MWTEVGLLPDLNYRGLSLRCLSDNMEQKAIGSTRAVQFNTQHHNIMNLLGTAYCSCMIIDCRAMRV